MQNIGPTNRVKSNFPTTRYSGSKRITHHRQVCLCLDGEYRFYDLKAYLNKEGKQCGKTVGGIKNRHFIKEHQYFWTQFR